MKRAFFVGLLLFATSVFGTNPNEDVVKTNTYIDMSGKIIYCSFTDLPTGVYYAKSENGVYKFAKVR